MVRREFTTRKNDGRIGKDFMGESWEWRGVINGGRDGCIESIDGDEVSK